MTSKSYKMASSDRMEKVDMTKEFSRLKDSDKYFIRKLEKMNLERAKDMRGLRRRNLLTGALLGGSVVGIYFYSMYAVRQEKFLEGFDVVPADKK